MLGEERKNEWTLIEEEFDEALHFWNSEFLLTVRVSFKFFSTVTNIFDQCTQILEKDTLDRDYESFCDLIEQLKELFFAYFAFNSES